MVQANFRPGRIDGAIATVYGSAIGVEAGGYSRGYLPPAGTMR